MQENTVNSLIFAVINVCVFETTPSSWRLIFVVNRGLVNYLGTSPVLYVKYVCGYLFLRVEDGRKFSQINPSQTLMNLQHW